MHSSRGASYIKTRSVEENKRPVSLKKKLESIYHNIAVKELATKTSRSPVRPSLSSARLLRVGVRSYYAVVASIFDWREVSFDKNGWLPTDADARPSRACAPSAERTWGNYRTYSQTIIATRSLLRVQLAIYFIFLFIETFQYSIIKMSR